MSPTDAARIGLTFGLAAALFAGAAVVAGGSAGSPDRHPAPGDAAVPRVERHSPREGYPSLGPAGAKNTLVFFTDYQ